MDTNKVLDLIEIAKKTGKIKIGSNEATKIIERGQAKFIAFAGDTSPKEIVMHLPVLCKEKGVPFAEIPKKDELGASSGIKVSTSAVVVVDAGDAKSLLEQLKKEFEEENKN